MNASDVASALRCRATNRGGARCRLDAPHLGQRHEPEPRESPAPDLDDPSDENLERQERRDDELRQEER